MKFATMISLSLLVASTGALADDWYVVGEVTHSKTKLDTSTSNAALTAAGATGLVTSNGKDSGNQVRLQLGYQVNPNFALEAGYIDFGKASYTSTYSGGVASGTVKAGGIDFAALGILPVTDSFSVFGKVGVVAAQVKSSISATGLTSPGDTKSTVVAPLLGLGVSYKISDNTDLRAEYDHVSKLGKSGKTDKLTSNMLSLGVAYHF
jgi:OOP family OmpA-OmpF porin